MTEYTVTIDGHESGQTRKTVEQTMREQFGGQDVEITVNESDSDLVARKEGMYLNIYYKGSNIVSISTDYDELLIYEDSYPKPFKNLTLSKLSGGSEGDT